MIFMGEEWGEPNPFLYFVSHTDEELCAAVSKGRKEEFAAFHADGEAPDPIAEESFFGSKLQWDILNEEPYRTMFQFYKNLIQLRKAQPSFSTLNRKQLHVEVNKDNNTLMLLRWTEEQHAICFMNFSKKQQFVMPPSTVQEWQKFFDSASPEWKGPQAAPRKISGGVPGTSMLTLQPESIVVYIDKPVLPENPRAL